MSLSPVIKAVLLVLACWLALPLYGQNARPPKVRVDHFSVEQGLSDRIVNDIVQDKQGFLWIATNRGLNRFDGYDFLPYDSRPRSSHKINFPFISRLLLDKTGRLLIDYKVPNGQFDLLDPLTGKLETVPFDTRESLADLPFQSPDGSIYVAKARKNGLSVYRFDEMQRRFSTVFDTALSVEPDDNGLDFLSASDGTFWFGWYKNKRRSILHIDSGGHILRTFNLVDARLDNTVEACSFLTETTTGSIWVALSTQGVYVLDSPESIAFQPHPLLKGERFAFEKDKAGNILAYHRSLRDAPYTCYLFTPDGRQINYDWSQAHPASMDRVYGEDFTKGFFSGSNNGFNKFWLNPVKFTTFLNTELGDAPYGTSVRGMAKSGKNKLLIAAERESFFELDLLTGQLTRPGDRLPQLAALNNFPVPRKILAQGDSVLWASSTRGVIKYRPAQNEVQFYEIGKGDVWGLILDQAAKIWLTRMEGSLLQIDPTTQAVTEYRNKDGSQPLQNSQPLCLIIARDGNLWAGTSIAGLIKIDPLKKESRRFTADPGDPAGLTSNQIACIYEDEGGLLWLGTLEGGLQIFDPHVGKVIAIYTRENGLCHNSVVGILPDGKGNYWLSTFNGLSFFDTQKKTFYNYSTADGLSHNEFNRLAYFYDPDARRYYFGGMNGVNAFNGDDLLPTENQAPLLISDISYANNDGSIFVQYEGVANGITITLPPANTLLHLRLALADYSNPSGNQFAYKIEGLDKDWNYLGTDRDLRLDHLPAGSYTLHLRGADNRGNWSKQEIALHLVVQAFWYKRWWAGLLYAVALASSGFYFYRFQLRQKMAQKEAHRLQELDAFKNRFFTNITHEFRTPLTVILGTSEQLKTDRHRWTEASKQDKLKLIKRNGESLLRLINQILDLAKMESNVLKMNYIQGDILPYMRYIAESLHSFANAQNVLLRVESTESEIVIDYDPERLLQIIHNLLSNAIKFTPSGGRVLLRVVMEPDRSGVQAIYRPPWVLLSVSDTGVGIPPEDLPYIFDRFYQANNLEKAKTGGTGIGLALTKELIQQMGGEISVVSTVGTGTTFTAKWPTTQKAPINEPLMPPAPEMASPQPVQPINGRNEVLLIEDNPDVVEYLLACLEGSYQLHFAYNGLAGMEKALEFVPDLIISDVMMPGKDGFEVCDMLKNDERTSHIPIILLTAKADIESRIAGLRRGADAYLAKPFHEEELLLTVANLLESRKKLQTRFANSPNGQMDNLAVSPAEDPERAFVEKVSSVVEVHLADASFSAERLCRALAMSQSQLHRKLTALTGKNATLFIRSIRLEKARTLLLQKEKTVSEIAFEVGFDDPKYFSRVFIEVYGVAPSKL